MIFPVFIFTSDNCRTWSSNFSVFNPHSTATTLTFEAFDVTGKLLTAKSLSVRPFTTATPLNFVVTGMAWAKVIGSDSVIINETLQAGQTCPASGTFMVDTRTRIDASPATPAQSQFVAIAVDKRSGMDTGLAIVYPSTSGTAPANGKLIHRDVDGMPIAEHNVVLGPNGQLVGMISDLLTESASVSGDTLQGTLEIRFDQPVSVTAFIFGWKEFLEEPVIRPLAGVLP